MDRRTRGGRPRRPSRPPPLRRPRPKNRPRKKLPTVAVKLIVRRLPPLLPAQEFAKVADAHGAACALWRSFMPGAVESTGSVKRTAHVVQHSVAYFGFEKLEQAVAFHQAFNDYKFVDTAKITAGSLQTGSEYHACVERAISQSVPPLQRRNPPPMTGTIEADSDYKAFLKTLEKEQRERPISLGQTSAMFPSTADEKSRAKEVITPLMEDVRARRKERDDKKKAKSTPRSGRKGRQVAEQRTPDTAGKNVSRKKKRRGSEAANTPKRDETPVSERKPPAKNERKNGVIPKRNNENVLSNSQASASNQSPSNFTNTGATKPNGSSSGAKNPGRTSNRARYGRGAKGKGKFVPGQHAIAGNSPGHAANHSQDSLHGPVRLLKKAASTTSAT